MSGLFSSPGKQAQQAGQITQGDVNSEISNLEQHVSAQEGQLRGAIAGMPLNPQDYTAFGSTGPGLSQGGQTFSQGPGVPKSGPPTTPPPSGNPFKPPPPGDGTGGGKGPGGYRYDAQMAPGTMPPPQVKR